MADFGDVLRGLGSVLNPQVAQQMAAEQQQQRAIQGQVGMLGLQKQIEQQSPEYQMKMQQVKNELAFRDAAKNAGGDMTKLVGAAMEFGKPELAMNIYNQQETRAARIQQAHDALELKKKELEQRAEDKAADRASRELAASQLFELKKQGLVLQGELSKGNQELRILQLQLAGDKKAAAELDAENKGIEKSINNTSNRMKDVMPVYTAGRQLNEVLSKFSPDNVPGLGYAKNMDSAKMFLSQEGKDVSSSVKLLGNSILKAMSGQAVTPSEEVRQMAATMADGRFSAEDFYTAWPKISGWINDQVSLGTAGLTPKAKEVFQERTGLKFEQIKPRYNTQYKDGKISLKDVQVDAGDGWTVKEKK